MYLRLTIDGLEVEISTGIFIDPKHWDEERKLVNKADSNHDKYNKMLSQIAVDLQRHFDLAQVQEEIAPKWCLRPTGPPLTRMPHQ